jgi:hypothetical protein
MEELAFHGRETAGAERHRRAARRVSSLAQANQTSYNCLRPPRYDYGQQDHCRPDLDDPGFCDDGDLLW